jgi:hypothetical protein
MSALLLGFASGCGGGASDVPTITVKPAEKEAAPSADDTPVGDDTPSNGGSKDGFGTFEGRVVIQGTASPRPALVLKGKAARDPAVCAATANIPDESLLVSEDDGLANVFIYLKKAPKNGKDSLGIEAEQALELDQKGCIFKPHAMVVRTGEVIIVRNSDPKPHNIKTKPALGQPFEATLNQGQTGELVFDRSEPVPVGAECNYHTWMRAYQLPLDHPYGVVTKADGSFTIPNLPVGTHQFVIWHERSTRPLFTRFTVKIKSDGEVVEETIEVEAAKLTDVGGARTKTIKLSLNR